MSYSPSALPVLARLRAVILLLVLAPWLAACTTTTNLITGETGRGAYTWAQEVQLGREANPQVIAQFGLVEDQGLQNYVSRLGQAVLETSAYTDPNTPAEVRNTPFHFQVLDSPVVNAMALPGGYIYVTRGLLAHVENEAQLAVVLGHEIGHVLGRHASRQAASQQLGQLGLLGAAVLGGAIGGGRVAQGILDYGSAGVQLLFLQYSRDAERESDRAGVAYAEFAGYDAAEAARFFRTLSRLGQQSGAGGLPSFLSTHPDPGEREQTIPQLAAQYQPGGTAVNRDELLGQIEGIVIGENPRQGFTEGNTFYHPDLRFRFDYPSGWQLVNSAAAVQVGEPNGQAVLQFTFAQGNSAQAAASAFAGQQGVQVTDQQQTRVGGSPAYALAGTASTQQGALGFVAYFIEHGGNVYQFMGLTGANTFSQYRSQLQNAIQSFGPLTEARYLNRQPVRLEVVRAPRTAAFSTFLQGRPTPAGMTAEGLAIMNGVALNETVQQGTPLKLPQQ